MKYKILIIEDNKDIYDIISKYLESEGYNYLVAKDGFEGLESFIQHDFHLVILDIMMPGIDGFEVLNEIRKISDVPIIMLTARHNELDRIKGFDMGADDYVVKPFSVKELMKRIKVLIKRIYNDMEEVKYNYKGLTLYTNSMKLYKNNSEIPITYAEYKLLLVLFKNKRQVLSREQLIEKAYGHEYEGYDRNIDSYIKRIRQKIEDNPKNPQLLVTKYGFGYVFGGEKS